MIYWSLALGAIADDLPLVMSRYWRFSHSALVRVAALQHCGSHLWDELIALPLRPRPVALWASQQGPDPIDLLLWLGTSRAHDNPDRVCRLLSPILNLLADHPRGDTPPLVSGNWLRDELGLEGADIGKALAQLRSLEICGTIVDAIQARQYLVSHFPEKC
jgi:biotin operon repressor